jgi:exosortase A-associated hydrolase 2
MRYAAEVFVLPAGGGARGQRLCLHHRPQGPATRGAIVYVHPFAEEMNKSRRMAALQSRALAAAGHAVLQIDLLGCGDSSGDFGDATWDDWVADIVEAVRWMRERYDGNLTLWGLRAGCLLAVAAAQRIAAPADFLFWQPATAGKLVLQQFLRMRLAAGMQSGAAKRSMESLRAQLAGGDAIEVAGYRLAPALAAGLAAATLGPPATHQAHVAWLEVSTREDTTLLPASAAAVEHWQQADQRITAGIVQGPAFWQTAEIEEAPALISATVAALAEPVAA